MSTSDIEKETTSLNENEPVIKSDYDPLNMKHVPGNQQDDNLKSLQERLEKYKNDPNGTPWENAFKKLINPIFKDNFDVC